MAVYFPKFDRSIVPIKLGDFLLWAEESREITENSLRLPPVQRSALWTPKQILDLWDTLLRGLPIGSFFLSDSHPGKECRSTDRASNVELSSVRGYDLLDGQQRMRTILLAADRQRESRCLWIDPTGCDEDRILTLRLTTASQPFGYDRNGVKLPLPQRGQARVDFDRENPDYPTADHQIFDEHIRRHGVPPKPYRHPLAIPFRTLFEAWRSDRSTLADSIRSRIGDDQSRVDCQEVVERIDRGFFAFVGGEVALILVQTNSSDLLRLYDRIGAGGTPLSAEDRLYSIYKYHEPYVFNAIKTIHEEVGYILPPTKIASCAVRIASIETQDNRYDLPDVAWFAKSMEGSTDLSKKLRDLIPNDGNWKGGRLASVFATAFGVLRYRGGDDFGLPHVMIPELSPDFIHVLAYWSYLYVHRESDITPTCRLEVVRFALYWCLCCFNGAKASRYALKYLKNNKSDSSAIDFPGKALYGILTGQDFQQDRCAYSLFSADELRVYCDEGRGQESTSGWLSWRERFERPAPVQEFFRKWWDSGRNLLLWIQRSYLSETFRDYDPSSGRDDDKPYDLDHICARATWLASIYPGQTAVDDVYLKTAYNGRHILGEGVGNLWWIDSRVNRGLRDASIASKLGVTELQSVIAKAFDEASLSQWLSASVEDYQWTSTSREAFQSAVENRTLWLYAMFFRALKFDDWIEAA